ncbi:hypothetical protein ACYZTL_26510 [Pseudomonas sp. LB3P81]
MRKNTNGTAFSLICLLELVAEPGFAGQAYYQGQNSSPPIGDYSGIDPARSRSTRIEGTPFRTAKPGESFSDWATYAYSACANLPADRQGNDRDYCPKTVVATALQLGLITEAAIAHCRSTPRLNAQQSEAQSIYSCLDRGSFNEATERSSVVDSSSPSNKASALNTTGLMKPTLVAAIHAADWAGVPPSDLDGVYFLETFRQISVQCPNIVSEASMLKLEASIAAGNMESVNRTLSGHGSSQDMAMTIWGLAKGLSYDDCSQLGGYEYESCLAKNEQLDKPLVSPEAQQDVQVLVGRYGCGQEVAIYAYNFNQSRSLRYQQLGARYYIDSMKNPGDVAKYRKVFENCAHQAGDGAAYAWCGCYVKGLSLVRGGYANPPEAVAAASRSAFFKGISYLPSDARECLRPGEEMMNSWRSSHSPFTTACLVSTASATGSTTPGLMECEYQTAWGKIVVHDRNCDSAITSRTWGDVPISCR